MYIHTAEVKSLIALIVNQSLRAICFNVYS